ncbi:restriction endonuclease subunit S [Myroides odoratus]|uniref:restriction endonuclease subunit S n=1 Tax=Myroides odoratus TaxID=256 RepID=UPI0039AF4C31
MKRYEAYKDSGVDWIGEIPEGWEVRRLASLGRFTASGIDKLSFPNESKVKIINYTDIYKNLNREINSDMSFMEVTTPELNRKKNLVKKGDLIFLPSSETFEDLGLSALIKEDLENVSFSYHVLRFQFDVLVNNSFKKYFTNNFKILNSFSSRGTGSIRKTLNRNDFRNTFVILPPFPVQTAIAEFLDDKTAKIDQTIGIRQKEIELLKERRQILIQQAVTKGLDATVPMKDSGVDWIGEIPEHWEVRRLKYVFKILKRIAGREGYNILSITQKGIKVKNISSGEGQIAADYSNYQFCNKGEFAMNHMDLLTGWVDISQFNGVISPDYRVFESILFESDNNYLLRLLQQCYINKAFYANGQGVSMLGRWRFPTENFNNFSFPIPPVDEQSQIVTYLEAIEEKIAKAITLKEQEIEKLKEYKTVLIDNVVTGKVKINYL